MNRVHSINPSTRVMMFIGRLNFIDTQSSFDYILELHPSIIHIIPRNQRKTATEDNEYLPSKVLPFCNLCCLHMFCDSVHLKYIGTTSYDSQKKIVNISLALSNLKIVYNHRWRTISLTPDDLFSRYTDFLPLLSPNDLTWSFSLVTLFLCFTSRFARSSATRRLYLPYLSSLATSLL